MPNLIEVQTEFLQMVPFRGPEGSFRGHLTDHRLQWQAESGIRGLYTCARDDVKYTIEECKERDATYAAPLKVKVRLYNKENDEINEHEIFMGDLPLMTADRYFRN